jgi:hypothetical protein
LDLIVFHLFIEQVRKDWYVFAVLSTLPWVGRELYEKKEQALEHLLVSIEVFLGKRSKKHHAALRVWALDTPHPQEEVSICCVFFKASSCFMILLIIDIVCVYVWYFFCTELMN